MKQYGTTFNPGPSLSKQSVTSLTKKLRLQSLNSLAIISQKSLGCSTTYYFEPTDAKRESKMLGLRRAVIPAEGGRSDEDTHLAIG